MQEALSARSRRLPSSTPLPKSTDWILSAIAATLCAFLAAAAKIAAVFSKSIHGRLVAVNRPKKLLQLGRLRLQRCELAHEFVHRPSLTIGSTVVSLSQAVHQY
jgi:hypothetical protein